MARLYLPAGTVPKPGPTSFTSNGVEEFVSYTEFGVTSQIDPGGAPEQLKDTAEGIAPRMESDAPVDSLLAALDLLDLAGRESDSVKSTPTPERVMECGLPAALSVICKKPLKDPAALGEKLTSIVQL
jgi:hypothetical protein